MVGSISTATRWLHLIAPGKKPVPIRPAVDTWQAYVDSEPLIDWFRKNAFVGPKTATVSWPEDLPEEYFIPFLRGLWDTDGSLAIFRREDHLTWIPEFKSGLGMKPKPIVERARDEISKRLGLHSPVVIWSAEVWKFTYAGQSAKTVADYLYKDSPDHIRNEDRYDIYKQMCEIQEEHDARRCPCGKPVEKAWYCTQCWYDNCHTRIMGPGTYCKCGNTPVFSKGLCSACYTRKKRSEAAGVPIEEALTRKCAAEKCLKRAAFGKDKCRGCLIRTWTDPCPCGATTRIIAHGLCKRCYENQRRAKLRAAAKSVADPKQ